MTYEMQLPERVAEIDTEIQTLELLNQGLDGLQAIRGSLGEVQSTLGKMSKDLGGKALSASDIINIDPNPETGAWEVTIDTETIAGAMDETAAPANIAKEAIRAQTALEEIANPFGDHQSKLLSSLEKLSKGLDRGSELFASTQKAISNLERAWDQFDRIMNGEISADELIEAFDDYFSTVLEVLADTIGKVPGLGAFLEIYAKAIKAIVPDLKIISGSRAAKNAAIASVFNDAPPPPRTDGEPTDVISEQQESLAAQIEQLKEERMTLLSEHEAEQARRAVLEVNQLEKLAERHVQQSTGYPFKEAADITFSMQNALWFGWPMQIESLAANDPDDPRIAEIREKMAITAPKLRDALGTRYEMEAAKVKEIERMIREHPEVLSGADLLELQNRYPQLEDAISDIRAGNPGGTETFDEMAARATAAAAALDAERESGEETDFDGSHPADDDDAAVATAAAAAAAGGAVGGAVGGMSQGTRRAVILGGAGALAGALIIGAMLILPLGTPTETAASTSSPAAQQDQDTQTEQVTSSTAGATTSSTPPAADEGEQEVEESEEAMGDSADPPSGAEANPATTVREFEVTEGSLVFSVAVNGDGRTIAEAEDTKWYQAIFTFDTAEGAYEIRGTWKRGREMEGDVFDKDFTKLTDAVVVGEWTASDSFIITASNYGSDEVPTAVSLDILVRIDGGDDPDTDYGDRVLWESTG